MKKRTTLAANLALLSTTGMLNAADFPIGGPVVKNGMEIAAVYIQPTKMDPMLPGMMKQADIHLEADISATKDNPNGWAEGSWVPYLQISYHIRKVGSDWSTLGALMPMVASDGPHYAENIKLDGPGKYQLSYHIVPPPINGFYRHTDKETATAPWWEPFDLSWEFTYLGAGKKGGY